MDWHWPIKSFRCATTAPTGRLIVQVNLPQANWSGIATVGDALVFGLGSDYDPRSSGIEVLTPHGAPPIVPTSPS